MSIPFGQSKYKTWQCHFCLDQRNETKYSFKYAKKCPRHIDHAPCGECHKYPKPGARRHSEFQDDDEDDEPPSSSMSSDTIGFANNIATIAGQDNEGPELVLPPTQSLAVFEKEGRRHSTWKSKQDNGIDDKSS